MQKNALCNLAPHASVFTGKRGRHRLLTKTPLYRKRVSGTIAKSMKLIIFFLTVTFLQASAAGVAQTVSFSGKNVSLEKVFQVVEKQTGYVFFYDAGILRGAKPVTVQARNENLEEFLKQVFKNQQLFYFIESTTISLFRKTDSQSISDLPVFTPVLPLPPVIVKGKVVDEKGNPAAKVSIALKGGKVLTFTNEQGEFVIEVTDENAVLEISSVSYEMQTVKLNGRKNIQVQMKPAAQNIEEVVVSNGYFSRNKNSFTGSEVTIQTEDLKKVGALSVLQALSAFDPSVRLTESLTMGSNPNAIPDITIRGENGFDLRADADNAATNPNAPLYILDGVEVSVQRVYDLDINRIETITILKDASATALYGSRAANGVIVITSVRPKSGQIRATLNANYNISMPDLRDYNLMNAAEKLEYEKRAGIYTDAKYEEQVRLDQLYNTRLEEVKRGVDTYWLSEPLQTSVNSRYSLNLDGGDKNFRYGINLRYDTDKGVMKRSGRDRTGINVTFNYDFRSNFIIRNDLSVDNVKATNTPYKEFHLYANQNPYDRAVDENGEYIRKLSSGDWNPLADVDLPKINTSGYTSILDNFNIDWRIIPALRFQGRFSYFKQINRQDLFNPPGSVTFTEEIDPKKKGTYFLSNSKTDRIDGNFTLSYNTFVKSHSLNAAVGSNLQESESSGESMTGVGFVNPKMNFIGAASSFAENTKPNGTYDKSRLLGMFANVNYGYDNRYFADFSFRTDGSSKFGRNSQFAPFWSAGLAWNLHKEHFWNANPKNSFKIRGSVGSTGTTNFSSTQALTTYNYNFNNEYNGVFGVDLMGFGNPDLRWQNTVSYNTGIDLVLFKGKVTFNGDFYVKNTKNLLLPVNVAPSSGFFDYVENIGELRNVGVEGRLFFNLLNKPSKKIRWNATVSGFHNQSKIIKLSNQIETINARANNDANNKSKTVYRQYEAGRSQSALMVVRSAGIDPATGNEVYIKKDGTLTFVYDADDKIQVGDTRSTIEGTVSSNLTWKGFNLYLLFRYQYGGKIYNGTLSSKVEGASPYRNADKRVLNDRWKDAGDHATYRRIDDRSAPYQTTRMVFDNNLFALQSISLSYELPTEVAKRMAAERAKFLISTTDLFRFSSVKQERGTSYPFAQTISAGVNITF